MREKEPYAFVSYSRQDSETVNAIVQGLSQKGIKLWFDQRDLKPGVSWDEAIADALEGASVLLFFMSSTSLASKNILDEVHYSIDQNSRIIPIQIQKDIDIPFRLKRLELFDISNSVEEPINQSKLQPYIDRLAGILKSLMIDSEESALTIEKEDIHKVASSIAEENRGKPADAASAGTENSVFIVHGRDESLLDEIEAFVCELGIKPVVLTKIAGAEQSLLQKFLTWGSEAKFAIVLVSADDLGAPREQYEEPGVADRSLQFRARQNVILELGFFYGRLGWENVFVMYKKHDKVFPNFEFPSDLSGVVFDTVDKEGKWKELIKERLRKAKFEIA